MFGTRRARTQLFQHDSRLAECRLAQLVHGVFISSILGLATGDGHPSSYTGAMQEVIVAQLRPFERRKP